jgi:uncharacterized RDD family membrane protein YckC
MPASAYDAHETGRMHELHGAPLASFGRRAAAFLIDLAIGVVLFMVVSVVLVWATSDDGGRFQVTMPESRAAQTDVKRVDLKFFSNVYSVVWWVLYFGLATYFGKGQTPGKRIMRIRVVSLVHGHLSLWHSIERALGYGASALEFGFGFFQYFIHRNRRTVHDRIAETIVVDVPRKASA